MAIVNMPKAKPNSAGSLMSLAGAGAGALVGGPAGAGVGMSLGGAIGSSNQAPPGPEAVSTGPMERRMEQLNQAPLSQIRQGIDSLKFVQDDATRMELAKPLVQAEMAARQKA